MAKIQLIPSVSELGFFSDLATSRRKLFLAALCALGLTIAYGFLIGSYMTNTSRSIALNLGLIAGQFVLVLLTAYVHAMAIATVLFGDAWRDRVLLGRKTSDDLDDDLASLGALKDNSLAFFGIVALTIVGNYFAVSVATGDFMKEYNSEGFFLSLMRSPLEDERIDGLRRAVEPLNQTGVSTERVAEQVELLMHDDAAEVRMWSAWAAGYLSFFDTRDELTRMLEDDDERVAQEAAIALGRLSDPIGERLMIGLLPSAVGNDDWITALLVGLGTLPSSDAARPIAAMLGVYPADVERVALWALGEIGATSEAALIAGLWDPEGDPERQCAIAESFKFVATMSEMELLREAFINTDPDVYCSEAEWIGLSHTDEENFRPLTLVVSEPLREKLFKAIVNISPPDLADFLIEVNQNPDETIAIRNLSYHVHAQLLQGRQRRPRE